MLKPIDLKHALALRGRVQDADQICDYMPDEPFADEAAFETFVQTQIRLHPGSRRTIKALFPRHAGVAAS